VMLAIILAREALCEAECAACGALEGGNRLDGCYVVNPVRHSKWIEHFIDSR